MELVILRLLTRLHAILIGPPGTGESSAVQAMDAVSFEFLLGRLIMAAPVTARVTLM